MHTHTRAHTQTQAEASRPQELRWYIMTDNWLSLVCPQQQEPITVTATSPWPVSALTHEHRCVCVWGAGLALALDAALWIELVSLNAFNVSWVSVVNICMHWIYLFVAVVVFMCREEKWEKKNNHHTYTCFFFFVILIKAANNFKHLILKLVLDQSWLIVIIQHYCLWLNG